MSCFANLLVHHPFAILGAVLIISGSCIIVPLTLKSVHLPTFQDPQMGFTTRGTPIANRLTAWSNLEKQTRPGGILTSNPISMMFGKNRTAFSNLTHKSETKARTPLYGKIKMRENQNRSKPKMKKNWNKTQFVKRESSDGFCGRPDIQYSHIVIKAMDDNNIFTINSILDLCHFESTFTNLEVYRDLCTNMTNNPKCCKPWSLANYIAVLSNKVSCLSLTERDIDYTIDLLQRCSIYYHEYRIGPECGETVHCRAPMECQQDNAVYNILNYLTTNTFLPENKPPSDSSALYETMIFFPLARSEELLPFYHKISKLDLKYKNLEVVAMELGLKSALFDEILVQDVWLMAAGAVFVFFCIWLYTQSLFLTIMTIIAIVFSMSISYFMYVLVFEIKFFPFMNLLATIVAIGIGSDDAFIFCKIWHIQKIEKSNSLGKLMTDTFQHAFFSMFVTALTTTVAFLASYVSSVTAVGCFSIFAGTAVVANYILMVTWFPACVVIWERNFCSKLPAIFNCIVLAISQKWCCPKLSTWNLSGSWLKSDAIVKIWKAKEELLLETVIRLRVFWLILFFGVALSSGFIVFVYPRLELPNSNEFQMFALSHPFEQYDFVYKNHFWFTSMQRNFAAVDDLKLPLRFVWGIVPEDNGNYLDPEDFGTLVFDDSFDIISPESQIWLLNFCTNLRVQPFYESMGGPLIPNCFIETFKKSMTKRCIDGITNEDRTPCCETSTFPFDDDVFNHCIVGELNEIYTTPSEFLGPGIAGPKYLKNDLSVIRAVIVEYYSNYSYSMSYETMNEFYTNVERWMHKELKSAPPGMKNGWFVSALDFYDLQQELSASTHSAITMSMALALVVLFISTLNVFTSLYAIFTITCTILVVMAVLVLMGWKLNILESVAVSTAIGLAVDFSLHYTVNYKMCPSNIAHDRIAATKHALTYMAGPALMAAITTGAAGAFMLLSLILPYIQIGFFLVLIMSISWLYATFFLGSLLATIGPQNHFGQFTFDQIFCNPFRPSPTNSNVSSQPTNYDVHELESLTCRVEYPTNQALQRSPSAGCKPSTSKYKFADQSPSATSVITIIMADDN